MTLRVLEAFSGVGSQRMALRNLGINHEVVAVAEIDKFAIASYEAIHGETYNIGDISKVEVGDIPDCDLFTYSFPCQDISVSGDGLGLDKDSGTRSGLLWECQKVIAGKKPKYLLLENVKNLVGKRHKPNFDKWLEWLENQGYTNYWQVLNAKDYRVPQNRERVFVISILGEHEPYEFPEPIELTVRLKDVLEQEVDKKFYLSQKIQDRLTINPNFKNEIKTIGSTKGEENTRSGQRDVVYSDEGIMGGALSATDYKQPKQILDKGSVRQPHVTETAKDFLIAASRGRNPENPSDRTTGAPTEQRLEINKQGTSNTLTTVQKDNYVVENDVSDFRIRKLTPKECWRLMGFSDEDFHKAETVNSNSQLYKQAGNSIVVNVLEGIFSKMFKQEEK